MKAIVFFAKGFEEAEAFCPMDVWKRAGIDVVTAGVNGREITSSHGFTILTDIDVKDAYGPYDIAFCPGGMPGATNLALSEDVKRVLIETSHSGIVSAICASPAVVLGPFGFLKGKAATCYPGCESYSPEIGFSEEGVVTDGNIVTGKSAGWAFDLGLKIVEILLGAPASEKVRKSIYYK